MAKEKVKAKKYAIGEFVLEEKLGEGGMGVVFKAYQTALDRWVALKLLSRPPTSGSKFVERFKREARAAARLVHPNIIQIYTIGEHKGTPYFAMEYVEGVDLARLLEVQSPLTSGEAVEIVRAVAKGLAMAHEQKVVHRDIKPANIMITHTGLVKVMDFGLAKATSMDESLTQDGQILGTPTYMSPEQGLSKQADVRSDLYALGCVLFECLTGEAPFRADNVPALIYKHIYEPVPSIQERNPEVPPLLEAICIRLLAKTPEERYQVPAELLDALAQVKSNAAQVELDLAKYARSVSAAPTSTPTPSPSSSPELASPLPMPAAVLPKPEPAESTPPPAPDEPTARPATPARKDTRRTVVFHTSPSITTPPGQTTPSQPRATGAATQEAAPPPPPAPPSARHPRPTDPTPTPTVPPPSAPFSGLKAGVSGQQTGVSRRLGGTSGRQAGISGRFGSTSGRLGSRSGRQVLAYFKKLTEGRWGYDIQKGRCRYAEGIAAEDLPGAEVMIGDFGDCLLCSNWDRRSGCAIAATEYVARVSRKKDVKVLEEQATIWCGARRFDKAIERLDEHMKANPGDAAGFRALARIYERPDNPGKDRERAIVLYHRFLQLAEAKGSFSALEIQFAQDRMRALQAGRGMVGGSASTASVTLFQNVIHSFRCFYRQGPVVFFAFGALSRERLIVAKAGALDPESGVSAAELGSVIKRATSFLKRIKKEKSKAREQEEVQETLKRLAQTPMENLAKESGYSVSLAFAELQGIEMTRNEDNGNRLLTLRGQRKEHTLIFPRQSQLAAEKCALILKRFTGK